MARILGIDYGLKRCGISATDPLQIIVNALDTVPTENLMTFLSTYIQNENVEKIVIGLPQHKDGTDTELRPFIDQLAQTCNKQFPNILIDYIDERFTSVFAKNVILQSGIKKQKRRDKTLVDKVSATIILQKYLNHI